MLHITDKAVSRLSYLAASHNKQYVRLSVKGGGCAGFEYDWSYADGETRTDVVLKEVLVIDRMFELYLLGTTLNWKEDDFKSEFIITNPNSKSSCGCGESFSV
jgi:iron-sulfur cluster assembly accessory protein